MTRDGENPNAQKMRNKSKSKQRVEKNSTGGEPFKRFKKEDQNGSNAKLNDESEERDLRGEMDDYYINGRGVNTKGDQICINARGKKPQK